MKNIITARDRHFKLYRMTLLFLWTIFIIFLAISHISSLRETIKEMALNEARANFNKDKALRLWSSSHGGVYVPISETTQPNPYLADIPERDIKTPSNRKLTLMNPAYMIRQMNEFFSQYFGITGHITSLNPLRPENTPDSWERETLKLFEEGAAERIDFIYAGDKLTLRLMQPLLTGKECLKCHRHQGYKEGDIRGGVSVILPMDGYIFREREQIKIDVISFSFLWLLGTAGIFLGSRRLGRQMRELDINQEELRNYRDNLEKTVDQRTKEIMDINKELKREVVVRRSAEEAKEQVIIKLNKSLEEIKKLRDILPICSYCKKIRNDSGYWEQLEVYFTQHYDADFSHGICPECIKEHFPEFPGKKS